MLNRGRNEKADVQRKFSVPGGAHKCRTIQPSLEGFLEDIWHWADRAQKKSYGRDIGLVSSELTATLEQTAISLPDSRQNFLSSRFVITSPLHHT